MARHSLSEQHEQRRTGLWVLALLVLLLIGSSLPARGQAAVSTAEKVTVDQIKSDFDAAMGKALSDRIPELEVLSQRIGTAVLAGDLTGKAKIDALRFKYLSEVNQARYPEAHASFGTFAKALHDWEQRDRARATVCEEVQKRLLARDLMEAEAVATAALEHWSSDGEVAPALLYYKARALTDQVGRTDEALPVLQEIITNHVDSPWRPKAMRWLAHLEANGYGGSHSAALNTLSLLEHQYAGTWWEQYAHMKPALIFEIRMGEPQQALERYRQTLANFPDHKYATFCRREIERLQLVIEQQLIRDALEGLGKADPAPAEEGDDRVPDVLSDLGQMVYLDPQDTATP